MLRNSFYSILRQKSSENSVNATISINKDHAILNGHFPGQPVVPGVCMVQIAKELVEQVTKSDLRLVEGDNIKFLAVIDPNQNNIIQAAVTFMPSGNQFEINATLSAGDTIYFKLKATLQSTQHGRNK
jgi:3-hydroxyacyl-[acyl-carrier-protein] dehydratase